MSSTLGGPWSSRQGSGHPDVKKEIHCRQLWWSLEFALRFWAPNWEGYTVFAMIFIDSFNSNTVLVIAASKKQYSSLYHNYSPHADGSADAICSDRTGPAGIQQTPGCPHSPTASTQPFVQPPIQTLRFEARFLRFRKNTTFSKLAF